MLEALIKYIGMCMDVETGNKVKQFIDDQGFDLDDLISDINDNSMDESIFYTEFNADKEKYQNEISKVIKSYIDDNNDDMIRIDPKDYLIINIPATFKNAYKYYRLVYITELRSDPHQNNDLVDVSFHGFHNGNKNILHMWSDMYSRWKWHNINTVETNTVSKFFVNHTYFKGKKYSRDKLPSAIKSYQNRYAKCLSKCDTKINDNLMELGSL